VFCLLLSCMLVAWKVQLLGLLIEQTAARHSSSQQMPAGSTLLPYHQHHLLCLLIEADTVSESTVPLTVIEGPHLQGMPSNQTSSVSNPLMPPVNMLLLLRANALPHARRRSRCRSRDFKHC
jgi:hypothetical protein